MLEVPLWLLIAAAVILWAVWLRVATKKGN